MGIKTSYTINGLVFVLIALLLWFDCQAFFWRDDWFFIDAYFHKRFLTFILEPYNGHVQPLFKLVYYLELILFGKNTLLFQMINVISFGLFAYVFYLVFCEISFKENNLLAVFTALLVCSQPNWGSITLYGFQINIVSQLLFQALTILFYFKFVKSNTRQNFFLFILFLVIQNYFFGNGLFFPLIFIFHQLLESRFRIKKAIIVLLCVQVIFLLIQKLVSNQAIGIGYIIQNKSEILQSFFRLISVSMVRFFFIKQSGGMGMLCAGFLVFLFMCYRGVKKNRNMFLLGLLYLITASIAVPIARLGLDNAFAYYYSVLLFPAFFFLLFLAISSFNLKYSKAIIIVFAILLCGNFMLDIQVKKIYAYRDFKNKETLTNAVNYSKKYYYPFDDPCITDFKNIYADNFRDTSLQNSLGKNNKFEMDSAISKYLGKESTVRFEEMSNRIIENYKLLSRNSKFDMDINYEKQ